MRIPRLNKAQWSVLIVGLIVLVWLVAGIISIAKPKPKTDSTGAYYDSWSHQTVSAPTGKTPDIYGSGGKPVFLGFDSFLSHGMTADQLKSLEMAVENYSQTKNNSIKEVTVDVDNITSQHTPSQFLMLFRIKFNRKDIYNAKVDYSDLTSVQLQLMNSDGSKVYDSGSVDATRAE